MFPTEEELSILASKYMDEIPKVLHMENWWKEINPNTQIITIGVDFQDKCESNTDQSFCKETEKTIYAHINLVTGFMTDFSDMDCSLAHELTHAIGFDRFSYSLSEGICDYVQRQVGDWLLPQNISVQDYDKNGLNYLYVSGKEKGKTDEEIQNHIDNIMQYVGIVSNEYPSFSTANEFYRWYDFSDSFVDYLIQNYGIDSVTTLVLNGTDESSYKEYLGIEFDEVKANWLEYFYNYEPMYSMNEIEAMQEERTEKIQNGTYYD